VKHFLEISRMTYAEATTLIQRALYFKKEGIYPAFPHGIVANLFYENSTRTRVSFELAASHLGMKVVNLNLEHSSESKGETVEDTISTLAAMGITLFVIRHKQDGLPQTMAEQVGGRVHIINAGDGMHAHPSQALLDFMTIMEQKPNVSQLKIAIVGDLLHSRVAKSLQCLCALLGVGELSLIAPPSWLPFVGSFGNTTTSLKEGLKDADVVICLRVQRERLEADECVDLEHYRRDYAITALSLAFAKPDAMLMHPGPINRGVELDSEVASGPQSYILSQVQNGVYMRMAILESCMLS